MCKAKLGDRRGTLHPIRGCSSLDTLTSPSVYLSTNTSPSLYLFLEFEPYLGKSEESNNQEVKENRAFRILFITKKAIKKQRGFAWNFLETPIQSEQRCLSPLFQRTLFLMLLLFRKYPNPQARTNKMVNGVVYHPCLSRLASTIHPFIFL